MRSNGILVLGARNLGGAMVERFLADGHPVAAVARSRDSLDRVEKLGAVALEADACDPDALAVAADEAATTLGGLRAVVNAVSAARPPREGGAFGGGSLDDARLEDFEGWTAAVIRQAFVFLSTGRRALGEHGGTLIQVTGGSARRAMPGRGLWGAAGAGVRALSHAAAQEWRGEGVHVALLIADGTIDSPKTQGMTSGKPENATVDQADLAAAAAYLVSQSDRALTHELVVTPAGERWTP